MSEADQLEDTFSLRLSVLCISALKLAAVRIQRRDAETLRRRDFYLLFFSFAFIECSLSLCDFGPGLPLAPLTDFDAGIGS